MRYVIQSVWFLVLLLGNSGSLVAQQQQKIFRLPKVAEMPTANEQACEIYLEIATQLFAEGKIYRSIDTLEQCFENSDLRRTLRRGILGLGAVSLELVDRPRRAEELLVDLYDIDPFYGLDIAQPEVRYLRERVRVFPRFVLSVQGGMHAITRPRITRQRTISSIEILTEDYMLERDDPVGWQVQVNAAANLLRSQFDLNVGIGASRMSYRYTGQYDNVPTPDGAREAATVTFREKQWWMHLPVFLSYNLVNINKIVDARFVPYVYGGFAIDLLRDPNADINNPRIEFEDVRIPLDDVLFIGDARRNVNFSLLAGLGCRFHLKRGFFLIDAQYRAAQRNIVEIDNPLRFPQEEPVYIDSDFKLSNLSLSAGFGIFLFKAEVNRPLLPLRY